ncbi:hypothetical protein FRC04_010414 [Tulasnella sp. 424]|nr:hypothetical protein FRC04_010414 [Tulasnella sp. 424]
MQTAPVIDLGYAKYRGRKATSQCTVYLGIPYAEPPLGDRRFRKPVPLDTTAISDPPTYDALQYPYFAVQGATGVSEPGGAGSEDCLKVDIYVPNDATQSSQYPVMGGGYRVGAPKTWPFHHWIDFRPRVVIVSVYYRLQALGFLSHPDFKDGRLADLNAGIYDQIEALKWVKQQISKFGGDPEKICLPPNVTMEILTRTDPNTSPYAVKAPVAHPLSYSSRHSEARTRLDQKLVAFKELLKEVECECQTLEEQVEWLRSINAIELTQAADRVYLRYHSPVYDWRPVLDGDLIPDYPTKLLQAGYFADVPVIVGATTDESPVPEDAPSWDVALHLQWPFLEPEDIKLLERAYIERSLGCKEAGGDGLNRSATIVFGKAFSKVWMYRYNQPTSGADRVDHCADNWQMFRGTRTGPNGTTVFDPFTENEAAFAKELIAYWLSFVETGDPNLNKLESSPQWPEYGPSRRQRLCLEAAKNGDTGSGSKAEEYSNEEKALHLLWVKLVDRTQN